MPEYQEIITDIRTKESVFIEAPPRVLSREEREHAVNAERNRRLKLDFVFGNNVFQRDAVSVARINGAVSMALATMAAGVAPTEPDWANGGPFQWITADNTVVEMTPAQVVQFGLACAAVESHLVFKARELKDMEEIPVDCTPDEYWT